MAHGRYDNPVVAALAGVGDLFHLGPLARRLRESDRFDGRTVLITGASAGLGHALAGEAARRGAHTIMACRSGIPEAGERVRRASVSGRVEMRRIDLADLDSIHACVDGLRRDAVTVDVLVLNAATTLPHSRRARCGQDEMFLVNYLANFVLVNLLLVAGVLRTGRAGGRVVVISSDSHRGCSAIDYQEFGHYADYGIAKAINNYSYFKLLLNTFAVELSRRANSGGQIRLPVHVICPGPVNSNIIREAPLPLRIVLRAIFTVIFRSPARAARAPIYMAVSEDFEGATERYLHMFNDKRMDEKVYDREAGRILWERSAALWRTLDPATTVWSPEPATS